MARLGKPNGHDIKEGKFTLPLLHSLTVCSREERSLLQEILLKGDLAPHDVAFVMDFIKKHGGLEYTQGKAEALVLEAKQCLDPLPDSPSKASLLSMADYIIQRDF